jgi:nucleotide-binding universal stress UspA family protein
MYDDVLVPTDGSGGSAVATAHAVAIADRFDATLHAVSVVDPAVFVTDAVGDVDDLVQRQRDAYRTRAESAVARVRDAAADVDVAVRTAIREGTPHEALLDYATEHGVDLIVMGTHGRTGVDRYLLGSVAEKLIRTSHVPVVTVRGYDGAAGPTDYDDVLVPTDGSETATRATDHAIAVAAAFDATVHVLHAADGESGGDAATEAIADRVRAAGLDAVSRVRPGKAHAVIGDYVAEYDVDIVVMGTHGRSGLNRVLMGSVAANTVRTVDVPVLAVGPE